jgi:class I fructose-bisphosphate aldolase
MIKDSLLNLLDSMSGKYIFFPLDFGFYKQPTDDLINIATLIDNVIEAETGSVMLHKGLVKTYYEKLIKSNYPFFMHITASTGLYKTIRKVQVSSVQEAKGLGAVGVSTLIYLGNPYELEMLEMLGRICEEADRLDMLVYTMMYVADFENGKFVEKTSLDDIKYAARVAYELGVDIVETRLPDDLNNLNKVKALCPIPLIFGDRSSYNENEYVEMTKKTRTAGYDGVSICNRSLKTPFTKLINLTNKGLSNYE